MRLGIPVPQKFIHTQHGVGARNYVYMRWGKVLTTRMEGGQPVADVADSYGGIYKSVQCIYPGGGGPGDLMHRPLAAYGVGETPTDAFDRAGMSEVALLFPDTPRPHPVMLGSRMHLLSRSLLTGDETDPARTSVNIGAALADDNDVDLAAKTQFRSGLDLHHGCRVILGYTGFWGLDTTTYNKPAKVHVGEDMFMRLAHGLPAAYPVTERVPLANALFAKLDEILERIGDLSERVQKVETALQAATSAASIPLVVGFEPAAAFTAAMLASGANAWVPPVYLDIEFDHDAHKAAIFRISSKSAADEGG